MNALTLWLIRRTCVRCGKFTTRRHYHPACERALLGSDA